MVNILYDIISLPMIESSNISRSQIMRVVHLVSFSLEELTHETIRAQYPFPVS